jgi:S-adenosylmethionine synthetase
VEYIDGKPQRISAVVISTQHDAEVSNREIKENIIEKVILPIIPKYMITDEIDYYINPTGRFVIGGPVADAGLTGRKIIVDTYGGVGSHGGGCFSGKDPSKVDRSASYMSRYIAKNIVASGLAAKAEVQLAYAIGIPEPVSVMINTYETGEIADVEMTDVVRKVFPLTPHGIIEHLDLKRPIYRKTAAYGHFGRNEPEFTWEKTDMVDELKKAVK